MLCPLCCEPSNELAEPCDRDEFCQAQADDPVLAQLFKWREEGRRPEWSDVIPHGPTMKAYRSEWESLAEHNGLLYRHWETAVPGKLVWQLLVPHSLRTRVLKAVHGPVGLCHFRITKTLRQRFYWSGCRTDVELLVHCCDACTGKKGPTEKSRAPLQSLQSGAPMERVAVDVLGPFPLTDAGNRYVLAAMDFFTKWPEAYAVPDQSAVTTAERLLEEFFCRFGLSEELHSDQGRSFESQVMTDKEGRCPKLQSDWEGPCRVLERLSEVVYRIRAGRRTVVVHQNRFAPYRPKEREDSEQEEMVRSRAPELEGYPDSFRTKVIMGQSDAGMDLAVTGIRGRNIHQCQSYPTVEMVDWYWY
ncbi:hypothetical protein NFI96_023368 [Prochilodus magdalenae]|nr:hypothetical protein NFI96_023368 [Prochilodus magdalenae]